MVEKELREQISNGHYVIASKKPIVVSALAAIPKDGKHVRLIHDGSRPLGRAMHDYAVPNSVNSVSNTSRCLSTG